MNAESDNENSDEMTGSEAHMADVTSQLEMTARELIAYAARLDRLERRMAAHAVKTCGRLVAITRRADTVIDALAEREKSLGRVCDALGLPPVHGQDTYYTTDRARIDQTLNQIDVMANTMMNMAEQLDTIFEAVSIASGGDVSAGELAGHLSKLREGVSALDEVLTLKEAS